MRKRLRIALLIESSRAYGRNLLCGIADYSRTYGPWTFFHQERSIDDPIPSGLKRWKPDGLIVRIMNSRIGREILRMHLPAVDLLGEHVFLNIPSVTPDHQAMVRLAVNHLLDRRLQHLAFIGYSKVKFSEIRRDHFIKQITAKNIHSHVFEDGGPPEAIGLAGAEQKSSQHSRKLADWINSLPKPLGIVACNDMRAYQVLSACGEFGIPVPDAVSIVGVDNDPVLCELSDPPLSSVDPNAHKIGYKAAAMLHGMINGSSVPAQVSIDPIGLVPRHSTAITAIHDLDFAEIVRHIREHACNGLTVEDLIKNTAVSRSTLERWFAKHLNRSPSAEITRVKLQYVKQLLSNSNLVLSEIAHLAGFSHDETLFRVFKKIVGQTPGDYRKARHYSKIEHFSSLAID